MRQMKDSGVKWIPQIPIEWDVAIGKHILDLNNKPVQETDEVITCFRDGEVVLRSERREDGFTMSDKEIGYQHIDRGDIVIHGMDGFAGAMGISKSTGKGSPVLIVCNPKEDNSKYIIYYLRLLAQTNVFLSLATGIRERSCDLRWNKVSVLPFILPPLPEQQAIASYLDGKCSEIDQLVSLQEEMIAELKAYKQSVITEAVTKGLDPDAKMKDSGVEWIGEVPEGWEVCKLQYVVSLQSGQNLITEQIADNGDYPVFGGNGIRGYYNYFLLEGDYVLIGRQGALCGNINYAKGRFWPTEHAVVCYPRQEVNLLWLGETLRSMNLGQYSLSAAQPGLSVDRIKHKYIPLPPLPEQQRISTYLDTKTSEIDQLINIKQQKITELKEYKKSLIYECVTGKREIPSL